VEKLGECASTVQSLAGYPWCTQQNHLRLQHSAGQGLVQKLLDLSAAIADSSNICFDPYKPGVPVFILQWLV
jgi:hypothetical protein